MGVWTQVESDDQIQVCSILLQTSRPRYRGHLNFKNLANLLEQTNDDDGSDMFEMYLYQDDDDSDYDLVLVAYLSLKRDATGTATRHHWCLTFGVSPITTKSANQLYQILKAELKAEMANEPNVSFWYVYQDGDTFTSGSLFDQIVQLVFADGSVQKGGDQPESTYAAYLNDLGSKKLHRFEIMSIN
jgi:hypothetical protein